MNNMAIARSKSHTPEANAKRAASRARTMALKKEQAMSLGDAVNQLVGKRTKKKTRRKTKANGKGRKIPFAAIPFDKPAAAPAKRGRPARAKREPSTDYDNAVRLIEVALSLLKAR